ncbi:MAG: signal peptide peptidase SppA [Desulfosarcinaceae bacterium]|nr:signal peptide peptidase SppA [Desulfosarcinaceae bacterium]
MFTRRHPILFFILCLSALGVATVIVVAALIWRLAPSDKALRGEKIAVIEVSGPIVDARPTLESLSRFRDEPAVKALVLRIESPGGGVGPSQEIYAEVLKTRSVKPVVASMGAVAASGGYYIAAAADGIVANPGTVTGSIGVIMGYTNFSQLLERVGLTPVVIKSGAFKDTGSPTRLMTDQEKALLQGVIDDMHQQFVSAIVAGRKMPADKVAALADGRIFSGNQAKSHGLVDRLGNFEDAVDWAAELGGIIGKAETVYEEEDDFKLLRYLMQAIQKVFVQSAGTTPQLEYRYTPD